MYSTEQGEKCAQDCLEKVTHMDNLISERVAHSPEIKNIFFPICLVQTYKTDTMSNRGSGYLCLCAGWPTGTNSLTL